jgi:hypothetical protein
MPGLVPVIHAVVASEELMAGLPGYSAAAALTRQTAAGTRARPPALIENKESERRPWHGFDETAP